MAQDPFGRNDSYTKVLGAKTRIATLIAGLAAGCGPKEAEDPHQILAEDYERAGVEDESGEPNPDPGLQPATRAECEAATRRVFELGGVAQPEPEAVRERAEECVARGTTRREAQCVESAADENAVDRCAE